MPPQYSMVTTGDVRFHTSLRGMIHTIVFLFANMLYLNKECTMPKSPTLTLDVDLQDGVVPISRAASSLAALIKRAKEHQRPIIVTQKGYPTGVLLSVDLFMRLRTLAQGGDDTLPPEEELTEVTP